MYIKTTTTTSTGDYCDKLAQLREKLEQADAVLIGAGAGLSTSAGFVYTGERFEKYFGDFAAAYPFQDMYTGGFYPYPTLEEQWAYWSRYVYINRYTDAPEPVYRDLLRLVQDKNYFIITTNVDHCFQKAGFDKGRLFYTQGDYGLFQCSVPCHQVTYDNEETIRAMVKAQGYELDERGMTLPAGITPKMTVPSELVPHCPVCGKPMSMNLRADGTFVQDKGWDRAYQRYADFLEKHRAGNILFLELGVGANTPGVIKYPFWQMCFKNESSFFASINLKEAICSKEIESRSACIDRDIGTALRDLLSYQKS